MDKGIVSGIMYTCHTTIFTLLNELSRLNNWWIEMSREECAFFSRIDTASHGERDSSYDK